MRRQIDRNWCEGELGARVGLFPVNYVDMMHQDGGLKTTPTPTLTKPSEGQARAKFNFIAQSHLELSLVKGAYKSYVISYLAEVKNNFLNARESLVRPLLAPLFHSFSSCDVEI